jgi:hypothetical protein
MSANTGRRGLGWPHGTSETEFQIHRDGAVALTSRFSFELR